jgi:hypothetical protein
MDLDAAAASLHDLPDYRAPNEGGKEGALSTEGPVSDGESVSGIVSE